MLTTIIIVSLILLIIGFAIWFFWRRSSKYVPRRYGTYRRYKLNNAMKRYVGQSRLYYNDLPLEFDLRSKYRLSEVMNQENCEACWAFSTCQSISDRMRMLGRRFEDVIDFKGRKIFNGLSPFSMLSCVGDVEMPGYFKDQGFNDWDMKGMGCRGGIIPYALLIAKLYGVTDLKTSSNSYEACNFGGDKYRIKDFYKVTRVDEPKSKQDHQANELAIMHEIFNKGPVIAGYEVYPNHQSGVNRDGSKAFDSNGVYLHTDGDVEKRSIGHAISIIGWTKDNWICRNSYGADDKIIPGNGFFQMKKGENFCSIETDVWAVEI